MRFIAKGKGRWFNDKKGFGFIESEEGQDIFVYFSDIQVEGYKSLREDQPVEYEMVTNEKGLQAKNVVPQ